MKIKSKKKFYKKRWFGLLASIMILGSMATGCSTDEAKVKTDAKVEQSQSESINKSSIQDIKYSVENPEDSSLGKTKRYIIPVVVSQEVNVEQLKEIAKKIVGENKEKNKFNAITIGFYDYKEYLSDGYTLGKVTFAPDGDWAKATNVSAGDYSSMDYTFELANKDWSKRLTQNEVSIWKQFKDEIMKETKKLVDKNSMEIPDEDKISERIGKQNNLTKEKVNEILIKKVTWSFSEK